MSIQMMINFEEDSRFNLSNAKQPIERDVSLLIVFEIVRRVCSICSVLGVLGNIGLIYVITLVELLIG